MGANHRWAGLPHARVDLHCHSTASDGVLTPTALIAHAAKAGIGLLALTDHDTTAGLREAALAAQAQGIDFVPGVEVSVTWEGKTLHVVGLNINAGDATLSVLLEQLQQKRLERARRMAGRLLKLGVPDAYARAEKLAAGGQLTRTHFARVLVDCGKAKDMKQAFKRYLAHGRPGYAKQEWVTLTQALGAIHSAGGLAVLAHPLRYRLSAAWRQRMFEAFKAAGGDALEVSTGSSQLATDRALITADALRHQLLASVASDFHGPDQRWIKYGALAPLSDVLTPVWHHF